MKQEERENRTPIDQDEDRVDPAFRPATDARFCERQQLLAAEPAGKGPELLEQGRVELVDVGEERTDRGLVVIVVAVGHGWRGRG